MTLSIPSDEIDAVRETAPSPPTFEIRGIPVGAIDMDDAVREIERWIDHGIRSYVCITGAHGIIESRENGGLRDSLRTAGLVTPDGMPLVWVAWLRGLSHVRRVYGPDLMRRMSGRQARPGRRHFYFGGGHGLAEKLRDRLTTLNPRLSVVGCLTPPFGGVSPEDDEAMVRQINEARPDILWIGLSTPKQELWMASHRHRLEVPVMIGVGAAFDFLAGTKKQAPLWMQRFGLEWLFRLTSEPGRLFRRYISIVPKFLAVLIPEMFAWCRRNR